MCLIFTCGEHTFRKQVEGYEGVVCQCHNCGNFNGHVIKSHPWFTFCFIVGHIRALLSLRSLHANIFSQPVIPLSIHGYQDIVCNICNFAQPLQARQDVLSMKRDGEGGGGGGVPLQQQPPQGAPQGWGGQQPPAAGQQSQAPMRYG